MKTRSPVVFAMSQDHTELSPINNQVAVLCLEAVKRGAGPEDHIVY